VVDAKRLLDANAGSGAPSLLVDGDVTERLEANSRVASSRNPGSTSTTRTDRVTRPMMAVPPRTLGRESRK
jgi:hypothetical protein